MAENNTPTTSTTMPASQPTIPPVPKPGQVPTTSTPAASGGRVSPSLQNPGILTEQGGETYQYAIGVKGRKVFDSNGNLVRYEGYKYFRTPDYKFKTQTGAMVGARGSYVSPQYFSGDEDQVYSMSIEDLSSLQRAMNAVGLLGKGYSPGVADNATRAAYANLLEQANGYGEDTDSAILRLASVGAGRSGQLTQYRVSNEADVKAVISRVSRETLGRNLGEGDLTRLAAMYRDLEKQSGLAAGSQTQQEVVAAPSPEAFTESQLGKMFPDEKNARQMGSYFEAIQKRYQI